MIEMIRFLRDEVEDNFYDYLITLKFSKEEIDGMDRWCLGALRESIIVAEELQAISYEEARYIERALLYIR